MNNKSAFNPATGFEWRHYLASLPSFVPKFSLDPDRTALLIVDMQRSCADRNAGQGTWLQEHYPEIAGYYYGRVESLVIPNISRLLASQRKRKGRVIFLTVGPNMPDGSDLNPLRRMRESELFPNQESLAVICSPSSPLRSLPPEISPNPDDLVLNKVSRGAFNSTAIDQLLRNMRIDGLIVAGVVTNGCVWATVSEASDRGYKCFLVDDACAAFTQMFHDFALALFAHSCGKVLTTHQALQLLETSTLERSTTAAAVGSAQRIAPQPN